MAGPLEAQILCLEPLEAQVMVHPPIREGGVASSVRGTEKNSEKNQDPPLSHVRGREEVESLCSSTEHKRLKADGTWEEGSDQGPTQGETPLPETGEIPDFGEPQENEGGWWQAVPILRNLPAWMREVGNTLWEFAGRVQEVEERVEDHEGRILGWVDTQGGLQEEIGRLGTGMEELKNSMNADLVTAQINWQHFLQDESDKIIERCSQMSTQVLQESRNILHENTNIWEANFQNYTQGLQQSMSDLQGRVENLENSNLDKATIPVGSKEMDNTPEVSSLKKKVLEMQQFLGKLGGRLNTIEGFAPSLVAMPRTLQNMMETFAKSIMQRIKEVQAHTDLRVDPLEAKVNTQSAQFSKFQENSQKRMENLERVVSELVTGYKQLENNNKVLVEKMSLLTGEVRGTVNQTVGVLNEQNERLTKVMLEQVQREIRSPDRVVVPVVIPTGVTSGATPGGVEIPTTVKPPVRVEEMASSSVSSGGRVITGGFALAPISEKVQNPLGLTSFPGNTGGEDLRSGTTSHHGKHPPHAHVGCGPSDTPCGGNPNTPSF